VLAGVHEQLVDVTVRADRLVDRRGLHVVRPCAEHVHYESAGGHGG
jgi:hypothetical protein